jgi:hypothetical protein
MSGGIRTEVSIPDLPNTLPRMFVTFTVRDILKKCKTIRVIQLRNTINHRLVCMLTDKQHYRNWRSETNYTASITSTLLVSISRLHIYSPLAVTAMRNLYNPTSRMSPQKLLPSCHRIFRTLPYRLHTLQRTDCVSFPRFTSSHQDNNLYRYGISTSATITSYVIPQSISQTAGTFAVTSYACQVAATVLRHPESAWYTHFLFYFIEFYIT